MRSHETIETAILGMIAAGFAAAMVIVSSSARDDRHERPPGTENGGTYGATDR